MELKQLPRVLLLAALLSYACLVTSCDHSDTPADETSSAQSAPPAARPQAKLLHQTLPPTSPQNTLPPSPPQATLPPASPIVAAARSQIGETTIYDPAYVRLDYPGGDVPRQRGVCTDVVVRALRDACKMDLQKLLHEDMETAFSEYPTIWQLKKPDSNIDHRRVPNLQHYFKRKGYALPVTRQPRDYLPGDLVTCAVPPNRPHIMIVSDKNTSQGIPLVIHNIGRGTIEEDRLWAFPLTGHYRIPPQHANHRSQR